MKKRVAAILPSVTMLFDMNGIAMAQSTKEAGEEAEQLAGEEETVIEISSEQDLLKIADNLSGNYVLKNSITLKENWNPIDDKDTPFIGTLNGNGHVIRGMHVF